MWYTVAGDGPKLPLKGFEVKAATAREALRLLGTTRNLFGKASVRDEGGREVNLGELTRLAERENEVRYERALDQERRRHAQGT
jgi:hypothetical protein